MTRPLEGIKVIELGTHVAVPKATRIMADWGAEIIKVEPPKGEAWRTTGKTWKIPDQPDNNPIFQTENANKKSIAINLKSEVGNEIMMKLLSEADVFATNTRLKALKSLGLDYDSLKERFPKLIYAELSAYGETGPAKDDPGFDTAAFWARSGALVEWGRKGVEPLKPHPGFGDGCTGSALLAGILAALINRAKTGKGEFVQTSLYAASLWYNSTGVVMGQPQYHLSYPKAKDEVSSAFVPIYCTKDGDWVMIASLLWNKHAPLVFKMLGLNQYLGDPNFMEQAKTRTHLAEVIEILEDAFLNFTTEEILTGLKELDIPNAKVLNPSQVTGEDQAWVNGYLRKITLENGEQIVVPNSPVKFESVECAEVCLAPQLGADTKDILGELGYARQEIDDIVQQGIVTAL